MEENTCELMENCPTRKTLTEIIEKEGKAIVGSTNYYIQSQSTLRWIEDEFCEHKKPGFIKQSSGEKRYIECPTYKHLKKKSSE